MNPAIDTDRSRRAFMSRNAKQDSPVAEIRRFLEPGPIVLVGAGRALHPSTARVHYRASVAIGRSQRGDAFVTVLLRAIQGGLLP